MNENDTKEQGAQQEKPATDTKTPETPGATTQPAATTDTAANAGTGTDGKKKPPPKPQSSPNSLIHTKRPPKTKTTVRVVIAKK